MITPNGCLDLDKVTRKFKGRNISNLISRLEKETFFYQKDQSHSYLITVSNTGLSQSSKERYVQIEVMDTNSLRSYYNLRLVNSAEALRRACIDLAKVIN